VTEQANAGVSIHPWTPGPREPRLRPGAVDVWRVDLAGVADELLVLLSPDEQARAERMAGARNLALWARSRAALRVLLGRYLRGDPRDLRLTADERGKPALDLQCARKGLDADAMRLVFNLSHSGGTALYAFTTVGPVGIDVEVARRAIDAVAIAARVFGPAEAARLRKLDPEAREREFLRAWVRYEAALKCLGTGIGGDEDAALLGALWIAELDLEGRGYAAIALEGAPEELRCWDGPV
jgi:4'-phosphopantetheinyl transferase